MSLSKPLPILTDMPYHIKKMIVESIPSYFHRLPLRKVSKEFFRFVEAAKVEMKLEIKDKEVETETGAPNAQKTEHETKKEAIDHFKCFISKPTVSFFEMTIACDRAQSVELLEMLTATVHRPLHVKSFGMLHGCQARILEFLEPGTLKRVALSNISRDEAQKIFGLEQWKRAQSVYLRAVPAACEVWWNYPEFVITSNSQVRMTDLPRILQHLIKSNTFISGKIINPVWDQWRITDALGGGRWSRRFQRRKRGVQKLFGNGASRIHVRVFDEQICFRKML